MTTPVLASLSRIRPPTLQSLYGVATSAVVWLAKKSGTGVSGIPDSAMREAFGGTFGDGTTRGFLSNTRFPERWGDLAAATVSGTNQVTWASDLASGHRYVFAHKVVLTPSESQAIGQLGPTKLLRIISGLFGCGGGETDLSVARTSYSVDGICEYSPGSEGSLFRDRYSVDAPIAGHCRLGTAITEASGFGTGSLPEGSTYACALQSTTSIHSVDGHAFWVYVHDPISNTVTFVVSGVGTHPVGMLDVFGSIFAGPLFRASFEGAIALVKSGSLSKLLDDHPDFTATEEGSAAVEQTIAAVDASLGRNRAFITVLDALSFLPISLRYLLGPNTTRAPDTESGWPCADPALEAAINATGDRYAAIPLLSDGRRPAEAFAGELSKVGALAQDSGHETVAERLKREEEERARETALKRASDEQREREKASADKARLEAEARDKLRREREAKERETREREERERERERHHR